MRSIVRACGLALLLMAGSACGDPGQLAYPDPPTDIVPVQGVTVRPQVIQFATPGETRQLSAAVFPTNATDQAVSWESTDPSVASVDADGLVTARAAGVGVFITVFTHDGRHQASANVSVIP